MKIFLKILDIVTYCMLAVFASIFALIGLSALFLLVVEGDFMNIFGLAGFGAAWFMLDIITQKWRTI